MPYIYILYRSWPIYATIILLISNMIWIGEANLKALQVVRMLNNLSEHPKLVTTTSYFQGLLALRQKDFHHAEHFLTEALHTRHEIIAGAQLIKLWEAQSKWTQIVSILAALEPLDSNFFTQVPIEQIPRSEFTELLRILKLQAPEVVSLFAIRLLAAQRFADAEVWAATITDPQEAQRIIGISLFYQHHFSAAQLIFLSLYKLTEGKDAEISYWYGRTLLYNNDPKSAIEPLEKAVQIDKNIWYLDELATAYTKVGRCADATQVLQWNIQQKNNTHSESQSPLTISQPQDCQ